MFKKVCNLKIISIVISVIFLCNYPIYAKATLRIPVNTDKLIERLPLSKSPFSIETVHVDKYDEYADILETITDEERLKIPILIRKEFGIVEDHRENPAIRMFDIIVNALRYGKDDIEALFIAKNQGNEIIGAKILYKPGFIEELDITTAEGIVAVRQLYQRKYILYTTKNIPPRPKGVGKALRKTAFEHMIKKARRDKKYKYYAAFIASINEEFNLKNLKNTLSILELYVEYVKRDSMGRGDWYLINFTKKISYPRRIIHIIKKFLDEI